MIHFVNCSICTQSLIWSTVNTRDLCFHDLDMFGPKSLLFIHMDPSESNTQVVAWWCFHENSIVKRMEAMKRACASEEWKAHQRLKALVDIIHSNENRFSYWFFFSFNKSSCRQLVDKLDTISGALSTPKFTLRSLLESCSDKCRSTERCRQEENEDCGDIDSVLFCPLAFFCFFWLQANKWWNEVVH